MSLLGGIIRVVLSNNTLFLLVYVACIAPLVEISHTGTVTHRVHCTERLICVGRSNRVFWTFLGGGATPVANSTTRRHEIRTTIVNGMEQTQATLLFDPVIPRFPESYVCQILGDNPTALNVRVITNSGSLFTHHSRLLLFFYGFNLTDFI